MNKKYDTPRNNQDGMPIRMSSFYRYQRERGFKSIVLYVPELLHTQFKEKCRGNGLTMTEVLEGMLQKFIEK